jgi:hypothetical protein
MQGTQVLTGDHHDKDHDKEDDHNKEVKDPTGKEIRKEIARAAEDVLPMMPDEAELQQLPEDVASAAESFIQLLLEATEAKSWTDQQLVDLMGAIEAAIEALTLAVDNWVASLQAAQTTQSDSQTAQSNGGPNLACQACVTMCSFAAGFCTRRCIRVRIGPFRRTICIIVFCVPALLVCLVTCATLGIFCAEGGD